MIRDVSKKIKKLFKSDRKSAMHGLGLDINRYLGMREEVKLT